MGEEERHKREEGSGRCKGGITIQYFALHCYEFAIRKTDVFHQTFCDQTHERYAKESEMHARMHLKLGLGTSSLLASDPLSIIRVI